MSKRGLGTEKTIKASGSGNLFDKITSFSSLVRLKVKYSSFFAGSNKGAGTRVNAGEGITMLTFLYFFVRKSSVRMISLILSAVKYLFSSGSEDLSNTYLFLIVSR